MKRLEVEFSNREAELIEAEAEKLGLDPARVVRLATTEWLRDEEALAAVGASAAPPVGAPARPAKPSAAIPMDAPVLTISDL